MAFFTEPSFLKKGRLFTEICDHILGQSWFALFHLRFDPSFGAHRGHGKLTFYNHAASTWVLFLARVRVRCAWPDGNAHASS